MEKRHCSVELIKQQLPWFCIPRGLLLLKFAVVLVEVLSGSWWVIRDVELVFVRWRWLGSLVTFVGLFPRLFLWFWFCVEGKGVGTWVVAVMSVLDCG